MTKASPDSRPYPKGTKKNKKKIVRHYDPTRMRERIIALWADPIWAAKQRERLKKGNPGAGRPPGLPDGMRHHEFLKLKALADIKTQKVMAYMSRDTDFDPDNKIADAAIKVCVEILNLPGANTIRMAAAKTLLEYTQKKPQTASAITLKTAETFLDEIVANDTSANDNS